MKNVKEIPIPKHLMHPFFFDDKESVLVDPILFQNWDLTGSKSFGYEILTAHDFDCYKPWMHYEEVVPLLFVEWKSIQKELEGLYNKRNTKAAAPLMKEAITICLLCQFWSNEKPVILDNWQKEVEECVFIPINFTERMSFILSRASLYQSFKALEQIMIELEKQFARIKIKKQMKK